MRAVYFRCDASARLGYGHLSRCLMLAQEVKRRSLEAKFILRAQDELAQNKVAKQGFEIVTACFDNNGREVPEAWPENIPVVLDMAYRQAIARNGYLDALIRRLRHRNQRIVFLDSMGEDAAAIRISEHVDMVVSPYLGAETGLLPRASQWLAGARYVILPPAFQSPVKPKIREGEKTLLVTMGGADPWNLTEVILKSLASLRCKGWVVKVVAGLFFSPERIAALREQFQWAQVVDSRDNLLEDYRESDVVVSAAGLTRYEIAALRLPALLICPTDFCRDYLINFHLNGLADVLFVQDPAFAEKLEESLKKLFVRNYPVSVPYLIDGLGCSRVVDAILEIDREDGV